MACFSVRICGNPGIICIANTAFQCPHCGKKYNDKDDKYINRINQSKKGYTNIHCKCGQRFALTYNIKGDLVTFYG